MGVKAVLAITVALLATGQASRRAARACWGFERSWSDESGRTGADVGDPTGFRQDVWPHPRSRIVAPSSRGEVAAGFAEERNQRRTLDALHPSERDSSARRGGVTPEAARQAIGRIQAPRLARTTIGLSRMVRRSGSGCRAQTVPGAYRHVGLNLLERREHAPTTSQQGFRNQQPTERRGWHRPRSATPPRGGRGGVPPRRPEGHLVPVAVPVIPRGSAGTKGLPGGGGISATHWTTSRATSNSCSAAPRDFQMLPGCDEPESSLPRRGQAAVRRHPRRRRPWPGPRHVRLAGARPAEPRPRRPARPRQPAVVQQDPHQTPRRPARGRRSVARRRRHRSPRRGPARR